MFVCKRSNFAFKQRSHFYILSATNYCFLSLFLYQCRINSLFLMSKMFLHHSELRLYNFLKTAHITQGSSSIQIDFLVFFSESSYTKLSQVKGKPRGLQSFRMSPDSVHMCKSIVRYKLLQSFFQSFSRQCFFHNYN